ncbi:cyclic 3',5'-adenosine monophosphate phosphodiesterase (plasmid) [Variovorax sp. WDL1]|nr:Ser/Thr protein phosphatase family protein [Variovorax sp. WDL1]PNG48801.1 3',5'-cyclic adenosine monophosphate phosphodiesterase CpdA [Variovorax sp. B2]PNG49308.1 3',5'-cyclic adenosine monophosphate phosphodiesterase CpdA [Variovorax sp. B4]VTV18411.1 cyclic 3',5'-adenosine monophosphate phosphodiesterase [Variovorax sp. WDL1]
MLLLPFIGYRRRCPSEIKSASRKVGGDMKLLALSDLHLEFGTFRVPKFEADVVILAGDIAATAAKALRWAQRPDNFGEQTPIVFVPGNHEFYGGVMDTTLEDMDRAASGNVHALNSGEVVLQGVRFLGTTLWTDFALAIKTGEGTMSDVPRAMEAARSSMNDYRRIRVVEAVSRRGATKREKRRLAPEDTAALHLRQRQWLADRLVEPFDGPTVVVTHHAPHRGSLHPRFASNWVSTAYVNELPESFFKVAACWIHGHTHESMDYRVGNTRVVCNPRGYASSFEPELNPAFNPALIIEI